MREGEVLVGVVAPKRRWKVGGFECVGDGNRCEGDDEWSLAREAGLGLARQEKQYYRERTTTSEPFTLGFCYHMFAIGATRRRRRL
jgi:hypothetical protein